MDHLPSHGAITTALALAVFASLMVTAALRDVASTTIPDSLILWLAGGYAILGPLAGLAPGEMLVALGVAAMVFFATMAGFALGWMGGGDSKLLTVSALWIGPQALPQFLLLTTALGGLAALSILSLRHLPATGTQAGPSARPAWMARLASADAGVPYALPIGLAALLSLPATPWLAGF